MWRLKDLNQSLKKKENDNEQKLKKAQWEATYFRKKWQQKEREQNGVKSKDNDIEQRWNAEREPKDVPPSRNRPRAKSARPRVKRPPTKRRRAKRPTQGMKSRVKTPSAFDLKHNHGGGGRRGSDSMIYGNRDGVDIDEYRISDRQRNHLMMRSEAERENENQSKSALIAIRSELASKQSVIDSLTLKYREMASNLAADRVIQKRALMQCERYKEMLREKEEEKDSECLECDTLRTEMESMRLYLGNLQSENSSLQNRIGRLTAHSVLGDELESERLAEMRTNHGERVNALQNEVKQRVDEEDRLRDRLRAAEQERDTLREEMAALKVENKTMAMRHRVFEEESGVDPEDLECALDLIERSKATELGSKWKWMEDEGDGVSLRAKIDELQIQRRDLVVECTQNQNLLESQIDLNKKLERDIHRLSTALEQHQKQRPFPFPSSSTMAVPMNTVTANGFDVDLQRLQIGDEMNENISYRTTENVLSLNISHGELDRNLIPLSSLSLLIVDFLHFDSIQSPQLMAGHHPKYDLLCRFKLKMDRFVLRSLSDDTDTDPLRIHFVQKQKQNQNGNIHSLRVTATASISTHSLRDLLFLRKQTDDDRIAMDRDCKITQHKIDLISTDGTHRVLGALFFTLNLLRSVTFDDFEDVIKQQNPDNASL